jgi:hypothetical protein
MAYVVQFTDLALASAKAKASAAAVEGRAREELANLLAGGADNVDRLVFHVFGVGGCDFICYPKAPGVLEIDTCAWAETKLNEGPLAGQLVPMPRPESDG